MNTVNNIIPKRKFGQNFLVHPEILKLIEVDIKHVLEEFPALHSIVEVGPGMGALTTILDSLIPQIHENITTSSQRTLHVNALEIDTDAYNHLQAKSWNQTTIHLIDALELFEHGIHSDYWKQLALPLSFHFISNLPFNVGSRILVELAITAPNSPFFVILQDEVSRKVLFNQLERSPTLFGYWMNLFWDLHVVRKVPPHAFSPQPRVMCSILQGKPKKSIQNSIIYTYRKEAFKLLKTLTTHPRKTIHKNIALSHNPIYINQLQLLDIDTNERLTVHNYQTILTDLMRFMA